MCGVWYFFFGFVLKFFFCFFFLLQGEHITTTIITTKYRYRKFDKRFFGIFLQCVEYRCICGIFCWYFLLGAGAGACWAFASERTAQAYLLCIFILHIFIGHIAFIVLSVSD